MATLNESKAVTYEVIYKFGNNINRKEFVRREMALEYAHSPFLQTVCEWVLLETLEKIK